MKLQVFTVATLACVALPLSLKAQSATSAPLRMVPSIINAGENTGRLPGTVAIGGGRVAVGSPYGVDPLGMPNGNVRVFDQATGRLLRQISTNDPSGGDMFGAAVAIFGETLVVGAPKHSTLGNTACGAVYVYHLATGRLLQKLASRSFLTGEHWGSAVAVDRNVVVIGAPDANFGSGASSGSAAVWRLGEPTYRWVLIPPGIGAGDEVGRCVAIQGDLVVLSAPGSDVGASDAGRLHVYDAADGDWLSALDQSGPVAGEGMGRALALDGHRVLAAAPGGDVLSGRVVLWDIARPTAAFQVATLTGAPGEHFARSVAMHEGLVAIGCPGILGSTAAGLERTGAVLHYDAQLRSLLHLVQPPTLRGEDALGSAVALDRGVSVASVPGDDTRVTDGGAVWRSGLIAPLADLRFDRIDALSGDIAPGVSGNYATFGEAINTGAGVTATATLSSPWLPASQRAGLWSAANPTGLLQLARQSGVDDGAFRYAGFSRLRTNHGTSNVYCLAQRLAFGARTAQQALCLQNASTGLWTSLFAAGDSLPSTHETVLALGDIRTNNARDFLMMALRLRSGSGIQPVTANSDSAVGLWSAGSYAGVLREGSTASPIGSFYGQMPPRLSLNGDKGAAIMTAQPGLGGVTTTDAQFVLDNTIGVARRGHAALDQTGAVMGRFSSFQGVAVDRPGVVFKASLRAGPGVTPSNNEGLWTNRSGSTRLLLRKGDIAPGYPTARVKRFVKYGMNGQGDVLMQVQLSGPGVSASNDQVVYVCPSLAVLRFDVVVREGDFVPGANGAKVAGILALDFTSIGTFSNSYYGLLVSLTGPRGVVSAKSNQAWLVGRADVGARGAAAERCVDLVLRKGQHVELRGLSTTLTSLGLPCQTADAAGVLNAGMGHTLEPNFGSSTLKLSFSNRRQALINIAR